MARTPSLYVVLGFASTHAALNAEALLGDMGIETVPIPAPSTLSARCGIALRLEPADGERARRYLAHAGIVLSGDVEIEDV